MLTDFITYEKGNKTHNHKTSKLNFHQKRLNESINIYPRTHFLLIYIFCFRPFSLNVLIWILFYLEEYAYAYNVKSTMHTNLQCWHQRHLPLKFDFLFSFSLFVSILFHIQMHRQLCAFGFYFERIIVITFPFS